MQNTDNYKEPNKPLIIAAAIICNVIVLGAGAALIINFANHGSSGYVEISSNVNQTKFEDLTKSEAFTFLEKTLANDNPMEQYPSGFVGVEIVDSVIMDGDTYVSDLELINSYDNLANLKKMASEKLELKDNKFTVTEYDYYAIVKPNGVEKITSCDHAEPYCDSLLSFKKNVLDYKTESVKIGDGASENEAAYLKTRNPQAASVAMRTLVTVASSRFRRPAYSYTFEDLDDKFVLTIDYISTGMNAEMISGQTKYVESDTVAINLYKMRFVADKSSGKIDVEEPEYIKSIPITAAENDALYKQ